jgi:hypothetical protein
VKPTLAAFIDVANIPKKYGGELDFECGMPPVLDAAVRNVLTLSSPDQQSAEALFLTAPVRWVDGPDGDLIALGVGSMNGKPRREVIATLHSEAAQNAFPGMSRQNTRNPLSRNVTQEGPVKPVPVTVPPPPPAPVLPDPTTVPAPSPIQPAANTVPPPPITVQHAPTTVPPPPADLPPAPIPNGIENTRPGRIFLPQQQVPPPIQRSGTEYFTPPIIDGSELKRL